MLCCLKQREIAADATSRISHFIAEMFAAPDNNDDDPSFLTSDDNESNMETNELTGRYGLTVLSYLLISTSCLLYVAKA